MAIERIKLTLPKLGSVSINFFGEACQRVVDLYRRIDELNRQKGIKHLGLIAYEIDGANHTRYEYLMLECAIVDILDRLHKGNSSAQGTIKFNAIKHEGSSILKSWFLLSNLGHLKNTFGDEKPLLMYAQKTRGFRSFLISKIQSEKLREWADDVIENFDYERFHYVLAISRTYQNLRRSENRNQIISLFELLLLDRSDIEFDVDSTRLHQLRLLHKKIRDISIVVIDSHYSHTPLNIDLTSTLVSMDEFEGGVFGKDLTSSLQPFRQYLYEEIYLNSNALANQRSYEVKVDQILSSYPKNINSYKKIIRDALNDGLVPDHRRFLNSFSRIDVPTDLQSNRPLIHQFRILNKRIKNNCPMVEGYLDVNPYTKTWHVDFFIHEDFSNEDLPIYLSNICNLIKDSFNDLIDNIEKDYVDFIKEIQESALQDGYEVETIHRITHRRTEFLDQKIRKLVEARLFPCFQTLLLSTLRHFFKDHFRLEISVKDQPYQGYALSFDDIGQNYMRGIFKSAIEYESRKDEDRVHELEMLRNTALRSFEGFTLVFLARIDILDMTQPPDNMTVTDLDGVILKVNDKTFSLQLFEAKNLKKKRRRSTVARNDLKNKLVPVLKLGTRYKIVKSENYGAKLLIDL